jgi:hypothetical protein
MGDMEVPGSEAASSRRTYGDPRGGGAGEASWQSDGGVVRRAAVKAVLPPSGLVFQDVPSVGLMDDETLRVVGPMYRLLDRVLVW